MTVFLPETPAQKIFIQDLDQGFVSIYYCCDNSEFQEIISFCIYFLSELMFLETSALTGENVEEAFLKCSRTILTKIEAGIAYFIDDIKKWKISLESSSS